DARLTGPLGTTFDAPRYEFADTVFSVGSTTFSGNFAAPGASADSFFSGRFNGPQAAELMAHWRAPFIDTTGQPFIYGTMSGIWIGRRAD
ncbi:MAG TPA: hypothetical protein VD768_06785, partial [Sphingomicrobium sp.]|nr:hypothetical protein [Sphingomicrobium sp.]